jgi:hypothetical protein
MAWLPIIRSLAAEAIGTFLDAMFGGRSPVPR